MPFRSVAKAAPRHKDDNDAAGGECACSVGGEVPLRSARRRFRAQVPSWQCAPSKLLQSRGIDPHELWTNHVRRRPEHSFDPTLAYFDLILDSVGAGRPPAASPTAIRGSSAQLSTPTSSLACRSSSQAA